MICKVVEKEAIRTTAGTFDCFVIETENKVKGIASRNITTQYWFASGIGIVREKTKEKHGYKSQKVLKEYFIEQ